MVFHTVATEKSLMDRYNPELCRGNELKQALNEIVDGNHATVMDVVGGFSHDIQTCRRFTKRDSYDELMRKAYGQVDPPLPTVIRVNKEHLYERYPTLKQVEYDEEWLQEHPDVVEHIATPNYYKSVMGHPDCTADKRGEMFQCVVNSAKAYQFEHEWVVTDTDIVRLTPVPFDKDEPRFSVELNIYMEPNLVRAYNHDPQLSGSSTDKLSEFSDQLDVAAKRLEKEIAADERLTDDMLKGMTINLMACTVDLSTEFSGINPVSPFNTQQCYIHSRLQPLEQRNGSDEKWRRVQL